MTAKSVAIYGVNYWPEPTGIGPYTTELAEQLVQEGLDVRVITTFAHYPQWKVAASDRGRWRRRETVRGVKVTRLWSRMPKPMTGLQRLVFELSYALSALVHGPGKAEVVVGVSPGLGSGLLAVVHGRIRRRRVVLVVQDLAGRGLKQSGLSTKKFLGDIAALGEAFAARHAHRVIVISAAFVEPLKSIGVSEDRIVVLPNWARMPVVPDSSRTPHSPYNFLHAGSMGIKQGLNQVLELARAAGAAELPWTFTFMGDGSERTSLEDAARDLGNVRFIDPVSESEFPAALAAADVLVLCQAPANIDMSFPSKLTAYFAARRPVVAIVPSNGSVAEFLEDSGAGLVLDGSKPAAAVERIRGLLGDDIEERRLVARATEFLETQWDKERTLRAWVAEILPPDAQGCRSVPRTGMHHERA